MSFLTFKFLQFVIMNAVGNMQAIVNKPSWEPQRTKFANMQILRMHFLKWPGLKGL